MTDDPSAPAERSPLDDGDWIRYRVGTPTFRGETTVLVRGSGTATVTHEMAGSLETYAGTLPDPRLTALRETLAANDPRTLPDVDHTPVPDEPRVRIRGESSGEPYDRAFWYGEREEVDELSLLIDAFEGVVQRVTDGEVTH